MVGGWAVARSHRNRTLFFSDDGARLCPPVPDGAGLCPPVLDAPGCVRRTVSACARRRPARRAVPALPRSAPRSVVVVIGATWGFTLRGRGTLRSGEQMHRRQVPLASFAPSGNTDKLAKLYV